MRGEIKIATAAAAMAGLLLVLWRTVDSASEPSEQAPSASAPEEHVDGDEMPGDSSKLAPACEPLEGSARDVASAGATGSNATVATPAAEETVTLFGVFLGASSGQPAGVPVAMRLYDERWEERPVQADATGRYEAPGLHLGRWRVFAEAEGFCRLRAEVQLDPATRSERRDFVLQPAAWLCVKLVGTDGRELDLKAVAARGLGSLVELRAVATHEEPGRWLVQERKEPIGIGRYVERPYPSAFGGRKLGGSSRSRDRVQISYTVHPTLNPTTTDVPAGCIGVLRLDESLPAWVSLVARGFVLRKELVFAGAKDVVFTLESGEIEKLMGSLRFHVLDVETGQPARDFAVSLDWQSAQSSGSMKRDRGGAEVLFDRVPPGPGVLRILADGREPIDEQVVLEPGVATDLGMLRLQRLALIRARVLDQDGKPASVQINVFPLDRYEGTRITLANRFFQSSADGELKIDSVGRGRHLIRVFDEHAVGLPVVADTTFSDVQGLEVRVCRGTPVVLRFRADPPAGARVTVRTASDLPVLERTAWTTDPIRVLLAPGSYSVQVDADGSWLWTQGLRVESEPVDLVLGR